MAYQNMPYNSFLSEHQFAQMPLPDQSKYVLAAERAVAERATATMGKVLNSVNAARYMLRRVSGCCTDSPVLHTENLLFHPQGLNAPVIESYRLRSKGFGRPTTLVAQAVIFNNICDFPNGECTQSIQLAEMDGSDIKYAEELKYEDLENVKRLGMAGLVLAIVDGIDHMAG